MREALPSSGINQEEKKDDKVMTPKLWRESWMSLKKNTVEVSHDTYLDFLFTC